MKRLTLFNQQGAILIFSLVMLLLLTLLGTSMIQHNKLELAMTGNALQQSKSLASAETELKQAEQAIDTKRLNPANPGDHTCNSAAAKQVNVNDTMLQTGTGTATITAVYCLLGQTETQCTYTNGARDNIAACLCNMATEIYSLQWVSVADVNYGTQRTVESKYAVNCSAGQF